MEYLSIRGDELSDYAIKYTWNLLYAYMDAQSQGLIEEFPGDGLRAISRFKYQCATTTFAD